MELEKNGRVSKKSVWKRARFGEDAIIGNLDTGIIITSSLNNMMVIPNRLNYCKTCVSLSTGVFTYLFLKFLKI